MGTLAGWSLTSPGGSGGETSPLFFPAGLGGTWRIGGHRHIGPIFSTAVWQPQQPPISNTHFALSTAVGKTRPDQLQPQRWIRYTLDSNTANEHKFGGVRKSLEPKVDVNVKAGLRAGLHVFFLAVVRLMGSLIVRPCAHC
jgi:hypothetical protein